MSQTLISLITGIVLVVMLFVVGGVLTWVERRLLGLWQDRYGPNRAGPGGVLQVFADILKLLTKEDWIPKFADRPVFVLAPIVMVISVALGFAVIVFTPHIYVVDLNIGLLFFLAMSSMAVYGVALAGWASNNKYSLIGGIRAVAQMISYEVFMGIALMGVVIIAGSFSLGDIVRAQRGLWYIVFQPVGFVIFLIAGLAETRRVPFDIPEAETEIVAGFHTEYSGMKFALFFLSEYMGMSLNAALIVVLYFGGWLGPFLPPIVWFVIKIGIVIAFFILVRAALPRYRYDQLMDLGWKILLPLSLANLVVTGAVVLLVGK